MGKLTHKCTSFSKQSTRGHFRNKPCLPGDAASKNPKLPGHCAILCHIVPRKIGTQPTLRLICSLAACTENTHMEYVETSLASKPARKMEEINIPILMGFASWVSNSSPQSRPGSKMVSLQYIPKLQPTRH